MVQVLPVPPLAPQSVPPLLQGQTQVNADSAGVMTIVDMSLLAAPGNYILTVILPDFPQVERHHAVMIQHNKNFTYCSRALSWSAQMPVNLQPLPILCFQAVVSYFACLLNAAEFA